MQDYNDPDFMIADAGPKEGPDDKHWRLVFTITIALSLFYMLGAWWFILAG